jgi:hypothetical protein
MDALHEIERDALRPVHAPDLVGTDGHWSHNACVNWAGDASELYIDGFRLAALHLVEQLGHDQDFLVYPIVANYRQYLELRLKDIMAMGEELTPDGPQTVPGTHHLKQLWSIARKHIRREYTDSPEPSELRADMRATERLIEQFADLDPRGTSFRYARE